MATNTVNGVTASTATTLTSNGTTGPYSLDFEYSTVLDVEVFVDGVLKTRTTDYTFTSATQITFTSAPSNGATILIQRNTLCSALTHFFSDGSVLSATELNNVNKQLLHSIQELVDDYVKRDGSQTINASLVFEGSTNDANETTLSITDPTADRTITLPDITGTVVTTGDTGTVTSTMINDGTIVNADINASANISGSKLADDSVTLAKLGSGALPTDITVASSNIVDGTIVNADVNASAAIQGTKISPDFGSQNITTTGNATVGGTLGVTGNSTLSGTLTITGAIDANGGAVIDNIRIGITNDNEIDTASGNLTIDSAGGTTTIDDNLTVSGNSTLSGTLGVTGTSTLADVTGGAVITSGTSTSDTKVYSAKRAGEIFYGKGTVAEIQSGETWSSTDDKVATTAAIDARIIDFVDDVGGFDAIANETSFPTTNPQGAAGQAALLSIAAVSTTLTPSSNVITIANGAGTGNTVTINGVTPSTIPQGFGLIVESTSTLHTYNFHRLVPKATEVSTVAGIASNVTTVANIASNVTSVAGISANVTTVAGSISNVNNVGNSISSVNTASSNINSIANFGDQYQVASSNPSTDGGGNSLAAGDLYFNTTANELKVYNGTAWQGGVTASGNFASTTGNNFTGDNVYADNAKAIFGTGQDLKIHHSSNQSTIEEVNGSLNITSNGALSFNPSGSNVVTLVGNSTKGSGQIKLNCEQNSHGIILKGPPHSAAASYTLTLPNSIVTNGVLKTDGSGNTSFALIANASVDASAAIAGTKISPDFGSQNIATTGNASIGGTNLNMSSAYIDFSGSISTPSTAAAIYRPADNSLAISTANNERLLINNNGASVTGNITVTGTVDGRDVAQDGGKLDELYGGSNTLKNTVNIADGVTATTQAQSDNSTKVSTTAYVRTAISDLVNSAPSTLDTLSEIATALNNDAALNTTLTNSIATKMPLAGGTFTGDIKLNDTIKAKFGTGGDLEIYHDGSHSYLKNTFGNLFLQNDNGFILEKVDGTNMIKATGDNSVELYYSGAKKVETQSWGTSFTGNVSPSADNQYDLGASGAQWNDLYIGNNIYLPDAGEVRLGNSGDLQLYHNGSDSFINDTGTGSLILVSNAFKVKNAANNEAMIYANENGAVELYYNNSKKLATTSNGIKLDDDTRIGLGNGEDLQIYHDGNHSRIVDSGTGHLIVQTSELNIMNAAGNEDIIKGHADGAVELYYDNSKKLETTSAGVTVTGALTATGNITAFSDKTLKTDINTINDALGTVGKLRGVSYKWKENNEASIGVIAQEVEQVIPEVVHTSEHNGKEVKSVDYGKMVGVLIEAIKELKAEVEELKGAK